MEKVKKALRWLEDVIEESSKYMVSPGSHCAMSGPTWSAFYLEQ